jgi:hypothetical protein
LKAKRKAAASLQHQQHLQHTMKGLRNKSGQKTFPPSNIFIHRNSEQLFKTQQRRQDEFV